MRAGGEAATLGNMGFGMKITEGKMRFFSVPAIILATVISLATVGLADDQVLIPVQGILTDSNNLPITGERAITFSLYRDQSGTEAVWAEVDRPVTLDNGLFTVYLGEFQALDPVVFRDNPNLYLAIKIGEDPEIARVLLGNSPYTAFADYCGNVPSHTHPFDQITGTMGRSALPQGVVVGQQVCNGTDKVTGADVNGNLSCGADLDTLYGAGAGISIGTGNAISLKACGKSNQFYIWDGTNWSCADFSGEVGIASIFTDPSLAVDGVPGASITTSGHTLSVAADGISTSKLVDAAVTNVKIEYPWVTVTPGEGLTGGGQTLLGDATVIGIADKGVGNKQIAYKAVTNDRIDDGVVFVNVTNTDDVEQFAVTNISNVLKLVGSGATALSFDNATHTVTISSTAGTGTVTSVGTGTGLKGGPITDSGTISIDTAVVPRLGTDNTFSGTVTANLFSGSGAGLTNVPAGSVTGSIPGSQVSGDITGKAAGVTGIVAVANGGTGSATQNFVDLSTAQSIGGAKTFSSTISGSISGNAGTVTNGIYTTGSYADPSWITSIAGTKVSGNIAGNAATATTASTATNALALNNQAASFYQNAGNLNAGTLGVARLGDGSITNIKLATDAVGNINLVNEAVTNGKIASIATFVKVQNQSAVDQFQVTNASQALQFAAGAGAAVVFDAAAHKITVSATGSGGTVTSVATGTGLTGGPITGSGTIQIDTAVMPQKNAANTFSTGNQTIQAGVAANKGLIVQGATSQAANLQEWQNSGGTVLGSVSSAGAISALSFTGSGAGLTSIPGAAISGNIGGSAANVTGTVAIANGGTGSSTQNFVDLSSTQTVGGTKTFSSTITGSISGNAATVTDGLYSTGTYDDPSWLVSLAGTKIGGKVSAATQADYVGFVGTLTNTEMDIYANNIKAIRAIPGGSGGTGAANIACGAADNSIGASNMGSTIAGGGSNNITGNYSFIGGGTGNKGQGLYSAIPGGSGNTVFGDYGLAAGRNATANNIGSFVWSDHSDTTFQDTDADQFAVRATGGTRFQTNLVSIGGGAMPPTPASTSMLLGWGNTVGFAIKPNNFSDNFMIGSSNTLNFTSTAFGYDQVNNNYVLGGLNDIKDAGQSFSMYRNVIVGTLNKLYPMGTIYDTYTLGYNNTLNGSNSYVLGHDNTANSGYAFGTTNTVSNNGYAIGGANTVNTQYAVSIGHDTINNGYTGSILLRATDHTSGVNVYPSTFNEFSAFASGGVRLVTGLESTGAPRWTHKFQAASTNDAVNFLSGWDSKISANGKKGLVLIDHSGNNLTATLDNQVMIRGAGGFIFYTSTGTTAGAQLQSGGGSWSSLSDRDAKANFKPVDSRRILEKVAAMPVSTWNYKAQDASIRHLGPMAQDFYAAFGIGEDEKHITSIDSEGVALAAIQGLNEVDKEMGKRLDSLASENKKLKEQNAELAERLTRIEKAVASGGKTGGGTQLGWLLLGGLVLGGIFVGRRRFFG
jgi:hypothetical protein